MRQPSELPRIPSGVSWIYLMNRSGMIRIING
jgi:hypothetical protein